MNFTLYSADCAGRAGNCRYPHRVPVTDADSLRRAVSRDYVCAEYRDSYRNNSNFIGSNCLPADCDNDHSEDPADWVQPSDVAAAFPGVAFAVHYSRNHEKSKNGRAARPKFHVLFPIAPVTDAEQYSRLKRQVRARFPAFDGNALDAARFFFGTPEARVELFDGPMTLTAFLAEAEAVPEAGPVIPEGRRNATLSRLAGKILKRCGNTEEARSRFSELAACCAPPLEEAELQAIWQSALRFYDLVSAREDYVPPEQYAPAEEAKPEPETLLKPSDYSDLGQATVLAREYGDRLCYTPSTDYMVYNGRFWEESEPKAQGIAQELTDRQLLEAEAALQTCSAGMEACGAWEILSRMGPKRASAVFSPRQAEAYRAYEAALTYRNFAIRRRDSRYISYALKEARPRLEVDRNRLDADGFLLNTPAGTCDLRLGHAGMREHRAEDMITKMTAVAPSDDGAELWKAALDTFFLGDRELTDYVQEIVGLAAIGKVYVEALIIAYGEGRNGKSTFWNTVSRVLGSYSGNLSADALTVGCRRNVQPEKAEARGKRLLIAAEMEEGMRLNTSTVKQLCSTDEVFAEKKYKDPFSYVPTHTLVLYTNHLPRVGALDAGTWRRLIVIPFNAKLEGSADIKNFAGTLYEQAGGAVLSWIMEGARRVIEKDYRITQPRIVQDAIARYRENNDWLGHFLSERCEVDPAFSEKSGEVYTAYRNTCMQTGEYIRSTTDFYAALESADGFERRRTKKGSLVYGLRLKSEFLA